jgi:hypothetical protein
MKYLENKMDIDFIFLHRIGENDDIISIDIINLIDIFSEYLVHKLLSYYYYII